MDRDYEDMDILGLVDSALGDKPTRDEALADALGVRNAPRKNSIEPRSRTYRADTAAGSSVNRSGLLNPSRSVRDGSMVEVDISYLEGNPQQLLSLRPVPNLHPNVAIECLFEEVEESAMATTAFLTSNLEGSDLVVVGLLCPCSVEHDNDPNALRLLAIKPSTKAGAQEDQGPWGPLEKFHSFSVSLVGTIPCLAAAPVESTPVPRSLRPSFTHSTSGEDRATDILILRSKDDGSSYMCLYRSMCCLTTCGLPSGNNGAVWDTSGIKTIKNPVKGMIDFVTDEYQVRCSVSLVVESSDLAEKVLMAIESSMCTAAELKSRSPQIEFALKLRADCRRFEQALEQDDKNHCIDNGWLAVTSLLNMIVQNAYFGDDFEARKSRSVSEGSSPWLTLLQSPFHAAFEGNAQCDILLPNAATTLAAPRGTAANRDNDQSNRLLPLIRPRVRECLGPKLSVVQALFDSLHMIYEDCKLSSESNRALFLRQVGYFLVKTCIECLLLVDSPLLQEFLNHYARDLGSDWVEEIKSRISAVGPGTRSLSSTCLQPTTFDSPPDILKWADALVMNNRCKSAYNNLSEINAVCQRTISVIRIFKTLFQGEKCVDNDFTVVSVLCEEGFKRSAQVRDLLPPGIALPILEALKRCKENPIEDKTLLWKGAEFGLIDRDDLGCNSGKTVRDASSMQTLRSSQAILRQSEDSSSFADKDRDGLLPLQLSSAMFFPTDNRIKEAGRLLQSSIPCFLFVERAVEVTDHEYERVKQNKLLLLCRRTLALPVGRGMLTIGSYRAVAAEPLPIPDLCLAGRVPPTNANLALDMSDCQSGFKQWPEFHNGVAAGLRLPLAGETTESLSRITRAWIVYNRPTRLGDLQTQPPSSGQSPAPQSLSHAHGGLLLALGLRGHLSALEMGDIYSYLTEGHVPLTVGILLGMVRPWNWWHG